MSILQQAKKPEGHTAPLITIVASGGVGKSSLGGMFKNPLIVMLEDGSTVYEEWDEDTKPTVLDLSKSKDIQYDLKSLIAELGTSEHGYSTVVFDTITTLNLMYEDKLCEMYNVSNVAAAAGGFQRGYDEASLMHKKFIGWCKYLADTKGIPCVFLAHSDIIRMKNSPEEPSEYAVFGISMHKKSSAHYKHYSDAVLYLTKEMFITGAETNKKTGATTKFGRATESGNRILITSGDGKTGYIDAKNRYNLDPEIPVPHGTNPLLTAINFFKTQA